jgi:hypothetical protein
MLTIIYHNDYSTVTAVIMEEIDFIVYFCWTIIQLMCVQILHANYELDASENIGDPGPKVCISCHGVQKPHGMSCLP